jgi:hypothetical protein
MTTFTWTARGWLPITCVLAGCGWQAPAGEMRTDTHAIELGAETARVDLDMNAGELLVSGGAASLMEADLAYNVDRWKPVVEHRSTGGRSEIAVSQPEAGGLALGNATSRWELRLNDGVPVDVVANLGAGKAEMNLGSLDLRSVEVGIGAGEVHVDLRGMPAHSYDVRISGGVGEAVVYVPTTVGISATARGGIGSIDVEGLERRGEHWINPAREGDPVLITVDVQGGIGEIRLIAR